MDRCALFVDAGYVLSDGAMAVHGTRERESVSWDHAGLIKLLTGLSRERTGLPVLRSYWYESTAEDGPTPGHVAFAELPGVKLRQGRKRPGRREGVAAEMHRDLDTLARNRAVSDAVIVSADEDIADAVAEVQDLGMRVIAVHISGDGNWTISPPLRREFDDIVHVTGAQLRPFAALISATGQADDSGLRRNGAHPAPGLEQPGLHQRNPEPLDNAAAGNAASGNGARGNEPPGNEQQGREQRRNEVQGFAALNDAGPGHDSHGHEQGGIANGHRTGLDAAISPGLAGAAPPAPPAAPGAPVPPPDAGAAAPLPEPRQTPLPSRPLAPQPGPPQAQQEPEPQAPPASAPLAAPGPERPAHRRSGPSHSRQSQPIVPAPGYQPLPPRDPSQYPPLSPAPGRYPESPGSGRFAEGAVTGRTAEGAVTGRTAEGAAAGRTAEGLRDARFPEGPAAARFAGTAGQHHYPPASPGAFDPPGPATAYPPYQGSQRAPSAPQPGYAPAVHEPGRYSGLAPVPPASSLQPVPQPSAVSLADAVQAARAEGFGFGEAVARDAPALWLEAVLARKPRMPSDLETKLLQGTALPVDALRYDEVRNSLRRGFWDALERSRR